jgi:GTP-binding protein
MRAMRAISRSDVAVLVVDATEPIAAQDAHIAGYVWEAGRGLVVVVNKWDLVVPKDDHTLDQFTRRIRSELHFVRDVPMLFTSALTRQRVRRILDVALEVKDHRVRRIPTPELNQVIQDAVRKHQPSSHSGKLLKLRYVTQVAIDPPTFVIFVNDPVLVHFSYRRFLENQLREQFGFSGTALRLIFRSSREAPVTDTRGKSDRGGARTPTASRGPAAKTGAKSPGGKKRENGGVPAARKVRRTVSKP